jgi:catechol 2,3-dioxygenase-like lactoylglutathione lyase family enzyme
VFDHVTIRVADREASEGFYDTVLPVLGIERGGGDDRYTEWGDFSIGPAEGAERVTRRLHIGFGATGPEQVAAFWEAGTRAGFVDDGPPGPRPEYSAGYVGAFLLDPDGNSVEAVVHETSVPGTIDHLWLRTADLEGAARFYAAVGPHAGFRLSERRPGRVQFASARGSFSFVEGEPSERVHLAFGVDDDAVVDAFHRDLVARGYRDNGGPGERPEYHPGYYGAFVLDHDGHNVELVNHHRPATAPAAH